MAPDRGPSLSPPLSPRPRTSSQTALLARTHQSTYISNQSSSPQNFTLRGILIGLLVGLIICFSNTYFGLQTGWVSSMSMPSSLIGFAFFKTFGKFLPGRFGTEGEKGRRFTEVENVLVQSVAGSMGTMPLGCGFVGVIPAMQFLMGKEDFGSGDGVGVFGVLGRWVGGVGQGLDLSLWKLVLWALGLCFFGVVFAVPLRKQVIIREKLKFPSGTATALMIGVLHGKVDSSVVKDPIGRATENEDIGDLETEGQGRETQNEYHSMERDTALDPETTLGLTHQNNWKSQVRLLITAFTISGIYTLLTYFFPILRNLPIFGTHIATTWLWTLNPSLAYVGQGIIMGPATTLHMLFGAIIGWGVLSPLAKSKGWAPGEVDDWEKGSKGWIVWISLAIMLADSIVSLGYIAIQPLTKYIPDIYSKISSRDWRGLLHLHNTSSRKINYEPLSSTEENFDAATATAMRIKDLPEPDAPPEHLVNNSTVGVGLVLSIVFCIVAIHVVFRDLIPVYATLLAVVMALLLSIMGVRALGETDLNPVSGISKLAQLIFALIIPRSNPSSILINLIAGAVSESGALQAGDLLQDLKTGHLLGAAPNAQFWGQIIGSAFGAIASALIYKLYISVYEVPGKLFQVPTGYVWIFTARLVTGKGLPVMAAEWAAGAAVVFVGITILRIWGRERWWRDGVPGGIAVAVGIYNVPSFTIARTVGGLVGWWWTRWLGRGETTVVVLASGLILGEGVASIVNLLLASGGVWHL